MRSRGSVSSQWSITPRQTPSRWKSIALDGILPSDVTGQAELAWQNIVRMLESAGMTVHDLVKVTHYLLRAEDIKPYVAVRTKYLGDARPASMLLIVPELVKPEFLLEVEVIAARVES